jgi:hypothetical protein
MKQAICDVGVKSFAKRAREDDELKTEELALG